MNDAIGAVQVFCGGWLLSPSAYRLEPSPLDPTTARVMIVRNDPTIPPALRDQLDAAMAPVGPDAPPGKLPAWLTVRAFALVATGYPVPAFVELKVPQITTGLREPAVAGVSQ